MASAVMPAGSFVVVTVAVPVLSRGTTQGERVGCCCACSEPSEQMLYVTPPLVNWNCTLPVGVSPLPVAVIFTVRVTLVPYVEVPVCVAGSPGVAAVMVTAELALLPVWFG